MTGFIWLGWMICVAWNSVSAEAPRDAAEWVVDTWQTDAGLPHNSVATVLQGRDGYLWIATANGLARFDGVRFTAYRTGEYPRMKSNRLTCLLQDARGYFWIGTQDAGLMNFREGQFSSLSTADGLASDTILCLGEDSDAGVWAGTASGLSRWAGGRLSTFFKTDGLPDDRVDAVSQPRGSPVVFATSRGLCRFSGQRLWAPAGSDKVAQLGGLSCVLRDRGGRIWVGGAAGLFEVLDGETNAVAIPGSVPGVACLVEGTEGGIWLGTTNGTVARVVGAGEKAQVETIWRFPSGVTSVAEDSEGNLWAGTASDGLSRLKRRQLQLLRIPEVSHAGFAPRLFETPSGERWLLAGDLNLYRCHENLLVPEEHLPLPADTVVETVCAAADGGWWVGTLGGGLVRCREGSVTRFGERNGLSDNSFEALCPEADGGLWVATRNGGLNHWKDGKVTRFNTPWGFSGNFASTLAKDHQNNLWIGTTGDGLFRLKDGRFSAYTETNGLPSPDVRSLRTDVDGTVWVGTARGLCRFRDGRLMAYTARHGMVEEPILQLRADGEGHLWAGSSGGIYRLRKDSLRACAEGETSFVDAVPYGKEDGLPGLQCLADGFCTPGPGAGGVWFLTTKGLVVGERRDLHWNPLPPAVIIEQALLDNEVVAGGGSLRAPPGKDNLQFQFTALSLTAPGKILFRYQLEGLDRRWSEPTTARNARYPKVPPGDYRFRVTACNNDGVWSETGASLGVIMQPFWWATLWFRLAAVLAVLAALGGLYRLRRARRRELEKLRVRIAGDLHDDIGSSLWSIALLSRLLARHGQLGAQEKQDAEEINRIAVQTSNSIRDIIWVINPAFDTAHDLVLRAKDFAGVILRGVECRVELDGIESSHKLPLAFRQDLFLVCKEALTNIARHAQAKNVELRLEERGPLWRLNVRDDGVGFDAGKQATGNGLGNLRARAEKMGGRIEIQSQPGKGTLLVLEVPNPGLLRLSRERKVK